ncbi:hypothetical protein AB0D13_05630 [Streptomyces sp. NPDC048430]|uniref:hypothetical protein n=1 Tax=Streptomyces sp. NPDC048430 TaxID=3155388 RepID=UPI00343CDFFE
MPPPVGYGRAPHELELRPKGASFRSAEATAELLRQAVDFWQKRLRTSQRD